MKWIFLALQLMGSTASAESYLLLSALETRNPNADRSYLPTNSEVELVRYLSEDQVEVFFQNEVYVLDRFEFLNSVEARTYNEIQIASDPNLCPLDANGKLKPKVKWNFASAKLVVDHCPVNSVGIVRRSWSSPWKSNCRPTTRDLSRVTEWTSCAPPPPCNAAQTLLKNAGQQKRLAAWKLRCSGRRVTIPTDNDPKCTLPLGTPHTLVIHQTEGNMTDGPDALQRFHLNKGWDDIGYHYVLAKTSAGWRSFEGRVDGTEGSHSGAGLNGQSVAISVAGNFLPSANRGKPADQILPPPEAFLLLKSMVFKVRAQYPSIRFIYGHGEYKRKGMGCDTDCPSPGLQQFVNRMRTVYFP